MKILVIIKVPEPLLMNTGFWETNQLSLLHTRHKITSYNIVTVEGAAASRVFFHLKAEAVRMGEKMA